MNETKVLQPWPVARLAVIAVGVTAAVALVVAITVGGEGRGWLGYGFGGVPRNIGEALGIFLNNAKLPAAVGVAALVAQMGQRDGRARSPSLDARYLRGVSRACDVGLLVAALINVALVGLSVGVYGWRMVVAMLPHGPIEVAGYCVAASFYFESRRRPVPLRTWLVAGSLTAFLLGTAALLETFTWFG